MKHNRIWILAVFVLSATLLCGCMDVKNMTEEEEDLVAEYSAGILLRYSDKYQFRLITAEQIAKDKAEAEARAGATPTPETAVTPIPENTEEPEVTNSGGDTESETTTAVAEDTGTVSLNELFHIDGIDVSYSSYKFCKEYPEKSKGSVAPTYANQNEILLVATFSLKNNSGGKKTVDLTSRTINYTVDVDGKAVSSEPSVFSDLSFYKSSLKKNQSKKATVIFRLSKERQSADNITLSIEEGDTVSEIQLK